MTDTLDRFAAGLKLPLHVIKVGDAITLDVRFFRKTTVIVTKVKKRKAKI